MQQRLAERQTDEQLTPEEVGIKVIRSSGLTRSGVSNFYIRPALSCENKSRKYPGYGKMNKGIKRWYYPAVKYYLVDGHIIGSNNEKNVLAEYWRICEKEKAGLQFEVTDFKNRD